jgi:hypothetical protein
VQATRRFSCSTASNCVGPVGVEAGPFNGELERGDTLPVMALGNR